MIRRRLFWQLYPSYLLVTLVAVIAIDWYSMGSLRDFYFARLAEDLEARGRLVRYQLAERFRGSRTAELDGLCKTLGEETSTRITLIAADGTVLGDTKADPATMGNHADRPEVLDAIATGVGKSVRYSETLRMMEMYLAIPMKGRGDLVGTVRMALPVTGIEEALWAARRKILLAGVGIALAAAVLTWIISRLVSRPLEDMERGAHHFARGDLDYRLRVPKSEEAARLAEALNQMAVQLKDRMSKLEEQRNKQESLLSSMVEGVISVDADENVITLNRAAGALFRVEPSEAEGRPLQEVVCNPSLQRFVAKALATDGITEGEVVLSGGKEHTLQAHSTPLLNGRNQQVGAMIVMDDITALRHLEAVRRDFVANVSHELKTPITSIKGFVETLRDGALLDLREAPRFLEIVAKETDRLDAIVKDLLSLSQVEQDAKQGYVEFKKCKLREVLEAAIRYCEAKVEEQRMIIRLICDEDIVARINPRLLEQAVANLIDNAVKYSNPHGEIRVEADRSDSGIVIRVSDEGSGIEEEHLPRLFERFYRVDKARSRKLGGTGLGLAIVKHIAQAHGGRVTVRSTRGVGSAFAIHLPGDLLTDQR